MQAAASQESLANFRAISPANDHPFKVEEAGYSWLKDIANIPDLPLGVNLMDLGGAGSTAVLQRVGFSGFPP